MSSALRRTIYTGIYSFPSCVSPPRNIPIIAIPELQETGSLNCNTGLSPKDLAAEFENGEEGGKYKDIVDLSRVHEGWNSNIGPWISTPSAIAARALKSRQFVLSLGQAALATSDPKQRNANGDVEIAVFTHGGFLHYLTDDWEGNGKFTGTGWANTEYRSYEFVDQTEGRGGQASIRETRSSREERRGSEIPLSREEQTQLRGIAIQSWIESGFQIAEEEEEVKEKLERRESVSVSA